MKDTDFQWSSEGKSAQWSIFCESFCGFSLPFMHLLTAVRSYFYGTGKPPRAAGLGISVSKYLWIRSFEAFSALSKLNLSWLCLKAFRETGKMLPFTTKGFLSPLLLMSLLLFLSCLFTNTDMHSLYPVVSDLWVPMAVKKTASY